MGRETNIKSIRALEKQIEEHRDEQTIIHLKRVRNSLLNVSALPPETLGYIFHWNVIPEPTFEAELVKGSYNFLLVCHHWFEVAVRTPELWGFWGNNLEDWKKRCLRSQAAPLNLVLDRTMFKKAPLNRAVREALRDHAARDTVRHIRLRNGDSKLLSAIISALITDRERTRTISLESLVLYADRVPTDVSGFFAHVHLPKLRHLSLTGCTISSWDHIMSRTTLLTTLQLSLHEPSPTPTTSRLSSILASNPYLEELTLTMGMIPSDGGDESSFQVKLRHLKRLDLTGRLPHLFRFLNQLECPTWMDYLSIAVHSCSPSDIWGTIGPYLRGYLQRRGKSRNGIDLFRIQDKCIRLSVSGVPGSTHPSMPTRDFANFTVLLSEALDEEGLSRLDLDLITHVPLEEVVFLRSVGCPIFMTDLYARLPNLQVLDLVGVNMSTVFPTPDQGESRVYEEIFPSLRHISFDSHYDWGPLMAFLSYRASVGNPIVSFTTFDSPHLSREVVEGIRGMVAKVRISEMYF